MPLWYHKGDAFGFTYNGEEYYYIKNVQNDVVAIADKNGDIVANNTAYTSVKWYSCTLVWPNWWRHTVLVIRW